MPAKLLIFSGLFLTLIGLLWYVGGKLSGSLPGDLVLQKGKWSFSFPLATSLAISLFLTVAINLFFYFFKK